MPKKFYACVYGGASEKISEACKEQTKKLGNIIVDNGFSLVYGAGASGCMGAVARGVRESGGYIVGITPYFIEDFEEIYNCDNTMTVDTMSERKTLMEKHADIFFIAPGGIGTMDEFFQIITLKYLKQLSAPIIILNIDGFYNTLLALIDALVDSGAAVKEVYSFFDVVESVDDEKVSERLKEVFTK